MNKISFSIPTNTVKGLLLMAAKKDVRYYLNGVCFELKGGLLRAIACDGYKLLAMQVHGAGVYELPDCEIIVKRDFLEYALKICDKKSAQLMITIIFDEKGKATIDINGTTSEPIEGRFPDWRRCVQRQYNKGGEWQAFTVQGEYLATAQKAIGLICNTAKSYEMKQSTNGSTHVAFEGGIAVIMGVHHNSCIVAPDFSMG